MGLLIAIVNQHALNPTVTPEESCSITIGSHAAAPPVAPTQQLLADADKGEQP